MTAKKPAARKRTKKTVSDESKVFANDPIQIARENQRHAVATAIRYLRTDGREPNARALHIDQAFAVLHASIHKCTLLDNRPLDAAKVQDRFEALWAKLTGDSEPVIAKVA